MQQVALAGPEGNCVRTATTSKWLLFASGPGAWNGCVAAAILFWFDDRDAEHWVFVKRSRFRRCRGLASADPSLPLLCDTLWF